MKSKGKRFPENERDENKKEIKEVKTDDLPQNTEVVKHTHQ